MYHLHVTNVDINDNWPIAWHVLIKLIWLSMISLFMPVILLFEYRLSLTQIFLFEALFSFFVLFFTYFFSLQYTARVWTVASMFVGVLWFIVNFIVLYLAQYIPRILILSPLFAAWYVSFFRVWYHAWRALLSKWNKNFWTQNSWIESIALIAWLLWPVLWWVLADTRWSTLLYIVAASCLLLSCIPFFFHQHRHESIQFSPRASLHRTARDKSYLKAIVASFSASWYLYFIWSVVWSLIAFSVLWSYTKLALISFWSWLLLLILFFYFWKIHDNKNNWNEQRWIRFLQRSFRWESWTWLFASIVLLWWFFSQFFFLIIDTMHKISYRVSDLWLMTTFYETIWEESTLEIMLDHLFLRELAISASKIVVCLIIAWITWYLQDYAYQWLIFPLISVLLIAPLGMQFITWKQQHEKTLSSLQEQTHS